MGKYTVVPLRVWGANISFFFPFNSTWGRVTLNSKTISPTREMRKAKPIFFSVGCRQIGWKKHKTRMYGSVRQFGMVWCLMAFGALYLSYPVGIWNQLVNGRRGPPSRGSTEHPQWCDLPWAPVICQDASFPAERLAGKQRSRNSCSRGLVCMGHGTVSSMLCFN